MPRLGFIIFYFLALIIYSLSIIPYTVQSKIDTSFVYTNTRTQLC